MFVPALPVSLGRRPARRGYRPLGRLLHQSDLPAVAANLPAASLTPYTDLSLAARLIGHVAAAALLGTQLYGLTVVAVQRASPSSWPNVLVPGSTLTLAEANVDLSVTLAGRFPPPSPGASRTTPGRVLVTRPSLLLFLALGMAGVGGAALVPGAEGAP